MKTKLTISLLSVLMFFLTACNNGEKHAQALIGKTYVSYWVNPYGDGSKTQIGQKAKITLTGNVLEEDKNNHIIYRECKMIWNGNEKLSCKWYYDADMQCVIMPKFAWDRHRYQAQYGTSYYDYTEKFKCYFDPATMIFEVYDYETEQSQRVSMMEQ